jgi:hypothetical protein
MQVSKYHGVASVSFSINRPECVNCYHLGMGDFKFPRIMELMTIFELSIKSINIERMQCSASWSTCSFCYGRETQKINVKFVGQTVFMQSLWEYSVSL